MNESTPPQSAVGIADQTSGSTTGAWILALILPLAGGSAWSLLALVTDRTVCWMAALWAALAALVVARLPPRKPGSAAALAAGLSLLVAVCAMYLWACAVIAGNFGVDFSWALRRTGFDFALAMANARLSLLDYSIIFASSGLAAGFAWRRANQYQPALGSLSPGGETPPRT